MANDGAGKLRRQFVDAAEDPGFTDVLLGPPLAGTAHPQPETPIPSLMDGRDELLQDPQLEFGQGRTLVLDIGCVVVVLL